LGYCNILTAELWGIYHGISIAASRGYNNVWVESDSSMAIRLLDHHCHPLHPCASLVEQIHGLPSTLAHVVWTHIHREGNATTDALAKMGHVMPFGTSVFDVLPVVAATQFIYV
jgi:ribonuclease HI